MQFSRQYFPFFDNGLVRWWLFKLQNTDYNAVKIVNSRVFVHSFIWIVIVDVKVLWITRLKIINITIIIFYAIIYVYFPKFFLLTVV